MVDVSSKQPTLREARASGQVRMAPSTLALVRQGSFAKGDVLAVARLAGIMAAKQTAALIPLCHPLPVSKIAVEIGDADGRIRTTFDIVWLSGWAPHPNQQQPLRPGSAKARLADALGTREISAGEKTGR